MGIRALRRLPPPTMVERAAAARAASALRTAIVDPTTRGARSVLHIDYSRRRSEWIETWAGLPGFMRVHGQKGRWYQHEALPGWQYLGREILAEMIPDLETLALHGEHPLQATR